MLPVLYLLAVVFLAKIVFDSPVGKALGEAIRNLVPPKTPEGAASLADLERLRGDVEEIRDRLEQVAEEQSFLTALLAQPKQLSLGPGEVEEPDTRE